MVRLSLIYDKEEKEQFFMLRGDEAYARSTKTLIELGTPSDNVQTHLDFSLPITVNVLRDRGDAFVVIYDNNVPVYTIDDWSSTDNSRTITLTGLNYDTTHNFQAQYMGNNQCTGSKSEIKTLTVQNANKGSATVTIDNTTLQYDKNASLTKTITLTNSLSPAYNYSQDIIVKYDGVEVDTYTTPSDGNTISATISDVGDSGLHTITAEYKGSTHVKPLIVTQQISVGYNLIKRDAPYVFVYGSAYDDDFGVVLETYLGSKIQGNSVALVHKNTSGGEDYVITSATTNSKGRANLSPTMLYANLLRGIYEDMTLYFKTTINNIEYRSEEFVVGYATPKSDTFAVTTSDPLFSVNNDNVFTINTGLHSPHGGTLVTRNIPIKIQGDLVSYDDPLGQTIDYVRVRTDSSGIATIPIQGKGKGEQTLDVIFGDVTYSVTYNDYILYWEKPSGIIRNKDENSYYCSLELQELNNYFRMIIPANSQNTIKPFAIKGTTSYEDYELIIEGLTTSSNCMVQVASNSYLSGNTPVFSFSTPTFTSHNNETWKIVRESGTVTVYKNNTQVTSFAEQDEYIPMFLFMTSTSGAVNINFTKLTLRGI